MEWQEELRKLANGRAVVMNARIDGPEITSKQELVLIDSVLANVSLRVTGNAQQLLPCHQEPE